jgi:hypothetical protein
LCNISISSQSLNGLICSQSFFIILCNILNESICSKLHSLKKSVATGLNHSSDGTQLVATGVDYYSSVAIDIDNISMPITTILLLKYTTTP